MKFRQGQVYGFVEKHWTITITDILAGNAYYYWDNNPNTKGSIKLTDLKHWDIKRKFTFKEYYEQL